MEPLLTATDPKGRTVTLSEDWYEAHILVEHPDVSDIDEIEQTIFAPDYITQDAVDDRRMVYYRMYQRRPQRWMLKVVVNNGEVITAYRVKRLKQGELILWRR